MKVCIATVTVNDNGNADPADDKTELALNADCGTPLKFAQPVVFVGRSNFKSKIGATCGSGLENARLIEWPREGSGIELYTAYQTVFANNSRLCAKVGLTDAATDQFAVAGRPDFNGMPPADFLDSVREISAAHLNARVITDPPSHVPGPFDALVVATPIVAIISMLVSVVAIGSLYFSRSRR